ncbi:MAG: metallophosphatase [Chitinophagales bacterium]|nr:metallophosphatase [Chitinophagales bacterium]
MQSRRHFLKSTLVGSTVLLANNPQQVFAANAATDLCILHTNDVHSRIEPFPSNDKKYPNMGGIAMRKTLLDNIRKQESNTLLLDAGDIFQGTPYFNFFHGDVEIDMMNLLGYNAATIGNHDFDGGIDVLAKQIKRANFPFVNCNYDFSNTIVNGLVHKKVIIKKGKLKIGITGCGVALDGLVPNQLYKETKYIEPIEAVQEQVNQLKQQDQCDLIICLSHLGYKYDNDKVSDHTLANAVKNLDLIIGGHTHTFLEVPTMITNKWNQQVIINQVGWAGLYLGQLNFKFEKKSKKYLSKHHTVIVDKKSIEK